MCPQPLNRHTGTDAAAEYNCSGEMTCDYYSSVGCDDDKRDYVSCYNPDVTSSRRRLTGSKEALEDVEVFRTLMEHKDLLDFPSMAKIVKEKQTKIIEERRRLDESDEDDSSCGKVNTIMLQATPGAPVVFQIVDHAPTAVVVGGVILIVGAGCWRSRTWYKHARAHTHRPATMIIMTTRMTRMIGMAKYTIRSGG